MSLKVLKEREIKEVDLGWEPNDLYEAYCILGDDVSDFIAKKSITPALLKILSEITDREIALQIGSLVLRPGKGVFESKAIGESYLIGNAIQPPILQLSLLKNRKSVL